MRFWYQKIWRAAVIALLLSALATVSTQTAVAAVSATPTSTYGFNGVVRTIETTESTTYVGGEFTAVGKNTSNFTTFPLSTGVTSTSLPQANNTIHIVISDGSGGWYVGGEFTEIGGVAATRVAHISSAGAVDTDFTVSANQTVSGLALKDSVLYLSGEFTTINGQARTYVAAVSPTTGTLTSFAPVFDAKIEAIQLNDAGTTLYAVGYFTEINATARNYAGAVVTSSAATASFDPNLNAFANNLVLTSDESEIYISGDFTDVNSGTTRNRLASFDTSTSTATAFNPNLGGYPEALTLTADDTILYTVGNTIQVNGGTTRNYAAAFSTATGTATAFNPNLNVLARDCVLSADESTLYIGGAFYTANGATTRNYFGAFDTDDGTLQSLDVNFSGQVYSLAVSGSTMAAGGAFQLSNQVTRNYLAAIDNTTGLPTSFNPNVDGAVYSIMLSPDLDTLYIGGQFENINGSTARGNIAAVAVSTGTATSLDVSVVGAINAVAVNSTDTILYVGGEFTELGSSATRNRAAAFTIATSTETSFDPDLDDVASTVVLSPEDDSVYIGGSFTTINGGTSQPYLAAFDADTGTATSFNPGISGGAVLTLKLNEAGTLLYAGGGFSFANTSTARNLLAALNTSTGIATSFNPNIQDIVRTIELSSDEATVYIGGSFSQVNGGTTRYYFAALSASTGTATSLNLDIPSTGTAVRTLKLADNGSTLFMGGEFGFVGDYSRTNFAQLGEYVADADPTPTPTPTSTPSSSQASGTTAPTTPTCSATKPIGAPNLFQINRTTTMATLYFSPVAQPITGYRIQYGRTGAAFEYADFVSHQSSSGVVAHTINALDPKQGYTFSVQAANDCEGGSWSTAFSIGPAKTGSQQYYLSGMSSVYNRTQAYNVVQTPTQTSALPIAERDEQQIEQQELLEELQTQTAPTPSPVPEATAPLTLWQKLLQLLGW